ncbi:MAG: hypothetical protein HY900_14840, partial [Deltaproteobacteria bacterium]|nr:hypothetical protein [Deltaproteobacteria bacterium]
MPCRPLVVLVGLLLLVAPLASADDIPLRDWTVPSTSSRLSALDDIGNPGVFVAVTPCRVVDTRVGMGFSGAYGPPALTTATRTFNVVASGCTGLPSNVSAFSLNFAVTNTTGPGHIIAWPAGGTIPNVSTLNYLGAQTLANAAIVPAGSGTSISVLAAVSSTDLIIDINGYFTNTPNAGRQLSVSGSFSAAAAMVGFNYSNTNGSHGVGGYAGGTGVVHGVQGEIGTGAAAMSAGVHGIGPSSSTIRTFGVYGESAADVNDAAGVLGRTTVGTPP